MPPRRVQRPVGPRRERRLAAVANAAGQRPRRRPPPSGLRPRREESTYADISAIATPSAFGASGRCRMLPGVLHPCTGHRKSFRDDQLARWRRSLRAAVGRDRFPPAIAGAVAPGAILECTNVRPPLSDRASMRRVPARTLRRQTTTTDGSPLPGGTPCDTIATRSGCSPDTRAPGSSLTRTGAPRCPRVTTHGS